MAAYGPKALKVCGEEADGFILQCADPDIARWTIGAVRAAAAAAGRDPAAVSVCVAAPRLRRRRLRAHAAADPLVRRHGRQPRRRSGVQVRRHGGRGAPGRSPTTSRARAGYDLLPPRQGGQTRPRTSCPTTSWDPVSACSGRRSGTWTGWPNCARSAPTTSACISCTTPRTPRWTPTPTGWSARSSRRWKPPAGSLLAVAPGPCHARYRPAGHRRPADCRHPAGRHRPRWPCCRGVRATVRMTRLPTGPLAGGLHR